MSTTKTVTLPTEIWDKIAKLVERHEDDGTQIDRWCSEGWKLMQARIKIAIHDAKENPDPNEQKAT